MESRKEGLNFIMENYWRQFKSEPVSSWINAYGIQKKISFITNNLELNNREILDVGCGSGIFTQLLALHASRVIGIDIVNRTEIISERKGNIDLALMNAEKLGFKEGTFDVVVMEEVLEHIPDDKKALKEVFRVLKPGGRLIISVPNKLFPFETHHVKIGPKIIHIAGIPLLPLVPTKMRVFETARVYTAHKLRTMLMSQGFSIWKIEYFMPSLDGLERGLLSNNSKLLHLARRTFEILEKSPIRFLGMTIILMAEKVK